MKRKENILLVVIWAVVVITGILALVAITNGAEGLTIFGRAHSLAVRTGLVYTAVYVFQIFWRKLQIKVNRPAKVTAAVVFHLVLHAISVHLAVAYTVYHAIHHGRKLLPVRVKEAAV